MLVSISVRYILILVIILKCLSISVSTYSSPPLSPAHVHLLHLTTSPTLHSVAMTFHESFFFWHFHSFSSTVSVPCLCLLAASDNYTCNRCHCCEYVFKKIIYFILFIRLTSTFYIMTITLMITMTMAMTVRVTIAITLMTMMTMLIITMTAQTQTVWALAFLGMSPQ